MSSTLIHELNELNSEKIVKFMKTKAFVLDFAPLILLLLPPLLCVLLDISGATRTVNTSCSEILMYLPLEVVQRLGSTAAQRRPSTASTYASSLDVDHIAGCLEDLFLHKTDARRRLQNQGQQEGLVLLCHYPIGDGACMPQNFWWGTVPRRFALLAPGRLGGSPYPLGAGLKIFGGGARATF